MLLKFLLLANCHYKEGKTKKEQLKEQVTQVETKQKQGAPTVIYANLKNVEPCKNGNYSVHVELFLWEGNYTVLLDLVIAEAMTITGKRASESNGWVARHS